MLTSAARSYVQQMNSYNLPAVQGTAPAELWDKAGKASAQGI